MTKYMRWIAVAGMVTGLCTWAAAEEHEREHREREHYEREQDEREHREHRQPAELAERVMHFAREHAPEALRKLEWAREEGREAYFETLRDFAEFMHEYREMAEDRPDFADRHLRIGRLNLRSEILAHEYREAKNEEGRGKIRDELEDTVKEAFHLQLEELEIEVGTVAEELEHMREMLAKRKEHADRIVRRRLGDLTEMDEALEWW